MPENKRQHYVPVFYLKYFSNSEDQKTIGLYNINNKKYIEKSSLKTQAYVNYFYGEDGKVEKLLGSFEGDCNEVISGIIETDCIPKAETKEFADLLSAIIVQDSRTTVVADTMNDFANKSFNEMMKYDDSVKEYAGKLVFELKNPVNAIIGIAARGLPIVLDLKVKLLVNKTPLQFIISDHPVIKYNQFLESKKYLLGDIGWSTLGLQVFFPISPDKMIVLYDSKIYKYGDRKKNILLIENENEVQQLNFLQLLSTNENIYFHSYKEHKIKQLVERKEKYVLEELTKFDKIGERNLPDGKTSLLYHMSERNTRIKLNISQIKLTDYAKSYEIRNDTIYVRKEEFWHYREQMSRQMDEMMDKE